MTNNQNNPLTREELAAYYTAIDADNQNFTDRIVKVVEAAITASRSEDAKILSELTQEIQGIAQMYSDMKADTDKKFLAINETNQKTLTAIKGLVGEIKKSTAATSAKKPDDPLFYSIKDAVQKNRWIKIVDGNISWICEATNVTEYDVLNVVYSGMAADGYDIPAIFSSYKKTHSGVNDYMAMIVESDMLRILFEKHLNNYCEKNKCKIPRSVKNTISGAVVDVKAEKSAPASSLIKVPKKQVMENLDVLRNAVCGISATQPKRNGGGRLYKKAYEIYKSNTGISLYDEDVKLSAKYKMPKEHHLLFAIAHDDNLVKRFCEVMGGYANV